MSLMPGAEWRGPLPAENHSTSHNSAIGCIVHHMDGSLASADGWFHNPQARASAHFGVSWSGHIVQWVDTNEVAYAQCQGNWQGYVSIETESDPNRPNDGPTPEQIAAIGRIIAWVGCPLRMCTFQGDPGVGYHRLFPGPCNQAWGQTSCPGDGFVAAMPAILLAAGATPPPAPDTGEEEDSMYPRIWTTGTGGWYLTWLSPIKGMRVKRPLTGPEAQQFINEAVFGRVPNLFVAGTTPWVVSQAALDALGTP